MMETCIQPTYNYNIKKNLYSTIKVLNLTH